jgi:hypothetical protein
MKCANGLHELDPDDLWRRSNRARCRECYYATQRRYDKSAAGLRRKIDYDIARGRDEIWILEGPRGDALREREEYEASGTTLSFIDWLNDVDPLPKLTPFGRAVLSSGVEAA